MIHHQKHRDKSGLIFVRIPPITVFRVWFEVCFLSRLDSGETSDFKWRIIVVMKISVNFLYPFQTSFSLSEFVHVHWRMGTSGVVFWRVERCWEMLKYMIFQVKPMSRLDKLPRRVDARPNFSACGWFPPIQTVQGVGLEMFPTWLVSDQQKPLPIKHGNWKSPIRIYKVLVGKASL